MYKGYLIDLDGTAYLGDTVIKETVEFVDKCKEKGLKILFLTNNASKTQKDIYNKLIDMGYDVQLDEIYTSAIAMATYLKKINLTSKIYVIGDVGLEDALQNLGIEYNLKLDYEDAKDLDKINTLENVVVGYTNGLNYKDLAAASIILQKKDSNLLVTNKDLIIPSANFNLPGNGSIINLLEKVNNVSSVEVGKPSHIIMEESLELMGLEKSEVCMIGDNYKTDILSGINNGIDTIFVETGVNTIKDVYGFEKQPNYVLRNLSEYKFDK